LASIVAVAAVAAAAVVVAADKKTAGRKVTSEGHPWNVRSLMTGDCNSRQKTRAVAVAVVAIEMTGVGVEGGEKRGKDLRQFWFD
jgi:homoserine kinase